jgi:hypothetical protein
MLCDKSETCDNKKGGTKVHPFLYNTIGPGLVRDNLLQKNTESPLCRDRLYFELKKLLNNIINRPKLNFSLTTGPGLVRDNLIKKYNESPSCRNRLDIYLKRIFKKTISHLKKINFSLIAGLGILRENPLQKNTESLLYRDRQRIKPRHFYLTCFGFYDVSIVEAH